MGCKYSCENSSEGEVLPLPISSFEQKVLEETWQVVMENKDHFGNTLFYRLFTLEPSLQGLFPEYHDIQDINELNGSRRPFDINSHVGKIMRGLSEGLEAKNDVGVIIEKMEALGARHTQRSLRENHLNALQQALNATLEEVLHEQWSVDVASAWWAFISFVLKTMKTGLNKTLSEIQAKDEVTPSGHSVTAFSKNGNKVGPIVE